MVKYVHFDFYNLKNLVFFNINLNSEAWIIDSAFLFGTSNGFVINSTNSKLYITNSNFYSDLSENFFFMNMTGS